MDSNSISSFIADFEKELTGKINLADSLFSSAREKLNAGFHLYSQKEKESIFSDVRMAQCELVSIKQLANEQIQPIISDKEKYIRQEQNKIDFLKKNKNSNKDSIEQKENTLKTTRNEAAQLKQNFSATKENIADSIAKTTSPFGDAITNDILASLIARSPEKYWHKYNHTDSLNNENVDRVSRNMGRRHKARVNRVAVTGFLGNLDVAVKMVGPADFMVKGVRMDADEALQAGARVANLATKYFAGAALMKEGLDVPDNISLDGIDTPNINAGTIQDNLSDYQHKAKQIHTQYLSKISLLQQALQINEDSEKLSEFKDLLKSYQNALVNLKNQYTP